MDESTGLHSLTPCRARRYFRPCTKRLRKEYCPGAWADGSGWKGVYDILVKDGFDVSIVQEPETSFKDDVAATKRVLARQEGPCILVAHSYGGAVIAEAEGFIPDARKV